MASFPATQAAMMADKNHDSNGKSSRSNDDIMNQIMTRTTPTTNGAPKTDAASSNNNTTGLSELSKQLRKLHATNQSQSSDIDRLERKLRIMVDLKGISTSDLKSALQQSCESEAHGELLSEISKLKAQLVIANSGGGSKKEERSSAADTFEKEASQQAIANLELRVGELEELNIALRGEISDLYAQLNKESCKATKYQALVEQLKQENKRLKEQEEEKKKVVIPQNPFDKIDKEAFEAAKSIQQLQQEEIDSQNTEIQNLHKALQKTTLNHKTEQQKSSLLSSQLSSRTKEMILRQEQYKSRHALQNERIEDLEQQVRSLYTAVDVLNEEHTGEKMKSVEVLRESLCGADEELARKLCMEEEQNKRMEEEENKHMGKIGFVPDDNHHKLASQNSIKDSPLSSPAKAAPHMRNSIPHSPPLPPPHSSTVDSEHQQQILEQIKKEQQSQTRQNLKSTPRGRGDNLLIPTRPSTPPPMRNSSAILNIKASGYLYKQSKKLSGRVVGKSSWKQRYFVLHQTKDAYTYQLSYGDQPGHSIRSKYGNAIITGVSTVEKVDDVPKYPHAFVIHTDPGSGENQDLYLGAADKKGLKGWLSILFEITAGKGTELERALKESLVDDDYDLENSDGGDENDFALERALQASLRHTSGATFVDMEDTCSEQSSMSDGKQEYVNGESSDRYYQEEDWENAYSTQHQQQQVENRRMNSLRSKSSSKLFFGKRQGSLKKSHSRNFQS